MSNNQHKLLTNVHVIMQSYIINSRDEFSNNQPKFLPNLHLCRHKWIHVIKGSPDQWCYKCAPESPMTGLSALVLIKWGSSQPILFPSPSLSPSAAAITGFIGHLIPWGHGKSVTACSCHSSQLFLPFEWTAWTCGKCHSNQLRLYRPNSLEVSQVFAYSCVTSVSLMTSRRVEKRVKRRAIGTPQSSESAKKSGLPELRWVTMTARARATSIVTMPKNILNPDNYTRFLL